MVARVGMPCDYRSYSMGIAYVVYMALHRRDHVYCDLRSYLSILVSF